MINQINERAKQVTKKANEEIRQANEETKKANEEKKQANHDKDLTKLKLTTNDMDILRNMFPPANIPTKFGGKGNAGGTIEKEIRRLDSNENTDVGSRRFIDNLINSKDQDFDNHVKNYEEDLKNLINKISPETLHKLALKTNATKIETLKEYINAEETAKNKSKKTKKKSLKQFIVDKYIQNPDPSKYIREWAFHPEYTDEIYQTLPDTAIIKYRQTFPSRIAISKVFYPTPIVVVLI